MKTEKMIELLYKIRHGYPEGGTYDLLLQVIKVLKRIDKIKQESEKTCFLTHDIKSGWKRLKPQTANGDYRK